jgi:WD40 repeat protein
LDLATQRYRELISLKRRGEIWKVAISPDGKTIATASGASPNVNALRLWSFKDGKLLHDFRGNAGRCWAVAFSPDGAKLASLDDKNALRFWDVETGQIIKAIQDGPSRVVSFAFSPDGEFIAAGLSDGRIKLWDSNSYEERGMFANHDDSVTHVLFHPSTGLLASISGQRNTTRKSQLKVWDLSSKACRYTFEDEEAIWGVTFTPDGRLIVAPCTEAKGLRFWDVATGHPVFDLACRLPRRPSFSRDGTRLSTATILEGMQRIFVWEARRAEPSSNSDSD